jgi:acetyl esterase/lipase
VNRATNDAMTAISDFASTFVGEVLTRPKAMVITLILLASVSAVDRVCATEDDVTIQPSLVYATHDGTELVGDLYLPRNRSKAPALVAMHGGGWQVGDRTSYRHWGRFLARNGYALFAIDYRLGKSGRYPAAVCDARAAIQFIRANAGAFAIDPNRIGLMGDSAGGHLAALLALAGDRFAAAYRDDANAAAPINVKAVVGFYGIYDMLAQWNHDALVQRKREVLAQRNHDFISHPDNITEAFLGVSPILNRRIYFESSPISYTTMDRNQVSILLLHGSRDDLVDLKSQTDAFYESLSQAGFFVQRVIISGAGHFWASEPFESDPHSYSATAAPRVLRFLNAAL